MKPPPEASDAVPFRRGGNRAASDRDVRRRAAKASLGSLLSGIISAAADNDPTTIATLAIAGASTIYGLEWLLLLIIPMFAIVQAIATHVAAITRKSLQDAIRTRYGLLIALISLASITSVSVITFAADLEAGGAAISLLTGIRYGTWLIPIAALVTAFMTFGTFERIRNVLVVLPLAFIAYVAAAFMAKPDWRDVVLGFMPHFRSDDVYVSVVIALIGTTLTAYTYLWQTISVAAESPPRRYIVALQWAAVPGTVFSGVILWFILIATAATLGVRHHEVKTAQDAASALIPVAGHAASTIFGIGLFGASLLALPVIAGGMANAISVTFRWGGSLDKRPYNAKRFYAALYGSIVAGTLLSFANVPPITLLFAASIAGGFATPITLALLVLLARDKAMMQGNLLAPRLAIAGWTVTFIATSAAVAFIRWH